MKTAADPKVLDEVLGLMSELADDWGYSGAIAAETRLIEDLGLESLDLVVLGTALQERYGKLPFSVFFAELGQQEADQRDVTVGELVAFVCKHRAAVTSKGVV